MTDFEVIFKAAFDRRDAAACLDVIDMGLRADTGDFRDWLCDDAALALMGYCIRRALDCEPPYLDSFALPVAECLAQVIQHFP
jgi:hypothetical protein